NEPAALDAHDEVDVLIDEGGRQSVDRRMETVRVLQQRRDVVEENASLRKVGHVADLGFEIVHVEMSGHLMMNQLMLNQLMPNHLMLKPIRSLGVDSSTLTSSTRAPGGPWRTALSKRNSASASPSAITSTRPSGRLLTHP